MGSPLITCRPTCLLTSAQACTPNNTITFLLLFQQISRNTYLGRPSSSLVKPCLAIPLDNVASAREVASSEHLTRNLLSSFSSPSSLAKLSAAARQALQAYYDTRLLVVCAWLLLPPDSVQDLTRGRPCHAHSVLAVLFSLGV